MLSLRINFQRLPQIQFHEFDGLEPSSALDFISVDIIIAQSLCPAIEKMTAKGACLRTTKHTDSFDYIHVCVYSRYNMCDR